jgi:hypothetical protein
MVFNIVVFPLPLPPIIAVRVPAGIDAETECKIFFVSVLELPSRFGLRGSKLASEKWEGERSTLTARSRTCTSTGSTSDKEMWPLREVET